MDTPEVEIRDLPPMSVIASRHIGTHPEDEAWRKLAAWAEPAGLLRNPTVHPVYGFNNPNPEPGRREYGYEFWIKVSPGAQAAPGLARKQFPGGRFAVTTCRLYNDPRGSLPVVWQWLLKWARQNGYRWRKSQELEHLLNPGVAPENIELELYLPIEDD